MCGIAFLQQSKMVVRHTFSADGISRNKPSEEVITVDLTKNVTLGGKKLLTEIKSSADAAHAVNTYIRFPLLFFKFMFLDHQAGYNGMNVNSLCLKQGKILVKAKVKTVDLVKASDKNLLAGKNLLGDKKFLDNMKSITSLKQTEITTVAVAQAVSITSLLFLIFLYLD